jgi:hypothetical protein
MSCNIRVKEWPFGIISSVIYSDKEIISEWSNKTGQGNKYAREKGPLCVVIKANTEEKAIAATRVFIDKFNIPSCAFYDYENKEISFYCGHVGSARSVTKLIEYMRQVYVY